MGFIGKFIIGAIALYLLLALMLYLIQRKLVFVPDATRVLPEEIQLANVEEITLTTANNLKLYCWYGKAEKGKPTLLYFHGNGGNIAGREQIFRHYMARGYGIFMLGYPGYSGSDGSPSEAGFVAASLEAYDYVVQQLGGVEKLVIYGESIGSSIAVQLAAKKQAAALILEAPMSSVTDVAQLRYPYFKIRPFLRDRFESDRHIAHISSPLLIVHGDQDQVIPLALGRKLYGRAPEPKEMHVIEGGGHNDLYNFPIVDLIEKYLDKTLK